MSWIGALLSLLAKAIGVGRAAKRDDARDYRWLIERMEEQSAGNADALAQYQQEHAACIADLAEVREAFRWLYGLCQQMHTAMEAGGLKPGPMPEMPRFTDRHSAVRAEFVARTAAHNAGLLRASAATKGQT